jgi:hypothetical protein
MVMLNRRSEWWFTTDGGEDPPASAFSPRDVPAEMLELPL